MANVDELLATAQEDTDTYSDSEESSISALSDEEFTADSNYDTSEDYTDPDILIISNKTVSNTASQVTVAGDERSQYVVFETDRYRDGIDLTDKTIKIHWQRPDGEGDNSSPVNVEYSSDKIRFGWIVPPAATSIAGTLQFMPFMAGTAPDGNTYLTQDLYSALIISESLSVDGGIVEPDESWYADFVAQMETYVSAASTSETNAASSASSAATSEKNASTSANTATTKASEASASANTASNAAATATKKASAAETSANNAATSESNAAKSATSASESAETATSKATSASESAAAAATSESNAKEYAESASEYSDEVKDIRNGADGTTYDSAGEAVRTQLNNKLDLLTDESGNKYTLSVENGVLTITQTA